MNSSAIAGWIARGIAFAGLVSTVLEAFNIHITAAQNTAIAATCGFAIVVLWPAYEKFHANAVAHKNELTTQNSALIKDNNTLANSAGVQPLTGAKQ